MNLPAPRIFLRGYQRKLVDELRASYRDDQAACLVLPTGGGKTVISAALAASSQDKNRSVWFAVHRDFLLAQTSGTFTDMGVAHGFIAAGQPEGMMPTMICSIPTLHRRLEKIPYRPDVIVWDECHHIGSRSWAEVWEWAGPDCYHMGLTATPTRLDGKGLRPATPGGVGFERMILGPTTAELMLWKNLSQYRAYAPSHPDLTGVGTVAGDWNLKQLKKAVRKSVIVGDVVHHYQRLAPGRRGIYFCVGVKYSEELAAAFTAEGIPAMHLDQRHSAAERIAAAQAFARGEIHILTNCGLFSEGYDLAAQAGVPVTVEVVGLVRPTKSESLHIQQMGRALRPKDEAAIIIDHAGNIVNHGLPDTDRDWTLDGKKKRAINASNTKNCPKCFAVVPKHVESCPYCGHGFMVASKGRADVEHAHGVLQAIDPVVFNERRRSFSQLAGQCKTLEDCQKMGAYLGYKPGWAWYAYKELCQQGYISRRGRF